MTGLRRLLRAMGLQALGGLVVWIVVAVLAWRTDTESLDLLNVLLLFAPLVVVPMGLLLIGAPAEPRLATGLFRLGSFGMRLGAIGALASLAVPRGELSAAVAALYLLPTLAVGAGLVLGARSARPTAITDAIAGVAVAAGALLFVLHRQDVAFAWLPELRLRVASAHLHFAGFALLAMAAASSRRGMRIGRFASFALAAGVALSVVATLLGPWGAVASSVLVASGVLALAAATIVILGDERLATAGRRLLFSSLVITAYVAGAALVGAIGAALGGTPVDVGSAVRLHGTFGAIGAVFLGLLGWRLIEAPPGR